MTKIGSNAAGTAKPARTVMIRRLFTWRMNLYRLIVGAVVLAIVLPSWVLEAPQSLVVIACILAVAGAVAAGTRVPSIRDWLGR